MMFIFYLYYMATINNSETLDPQDWEQSKALMHKMVDDAFDYVQHVRDRKIWQEMPDAILETFKLDLPTQPSDAENVYKELQNTVLPYPPMGNIHPRFWA